MFDDNNRKCSTSNDNTPRDKVKRLLKWRLFSYLMIGFSIPVIYVIWKVGAYSNFFLGGFQPSGMSLAQYTTKEVVGDLGGMKVVIPRYFAEYVEYDGDPGSGEKRKKSRPVRTLNSQLENFGMDVNFPDMQGLVDLQVRQEKRRQSLLENTWLRVGVSAGESYYGDGSLDRLSQVVLKPEEYPGDYWWNNYVRLSEDKYGLEMYVVAGKDPHGKPARESDRTSDVYLYRDLSGKVETHIRCRRAKVPNGVARCRLRFTLEPKAHVGIRVAFRRGILPQWRKIKASVGDLLLSFEVKGDTENNILVPDLIPSKFNH